MAKPKEKYEQELQEVIKANNILSLENIFAFYTGISRGHFYQLNLNKSDIVLKAIDDNKVKTKQSLLAKWYKSNSAALQIALFKLIGTDEEAHRLNGTKSEQKVSGEMQVTKVEHVIHRPEDDTKS